MSARQLEDQLGVTYKTAWLLTQKLRRRSMVDPERDPLEGVVDVDQAEIPFREGDAFFEPSTFETLLGWPHITYRRVTGTSSTKSILERVPEQSASRLVAGRQQVGCDRTA
jgi:hypothetical protein